jgi:hypothetical protein
VEATIENWSNWLVAILTATLGLASGLLLDRLRGGDKRRTETSAAEIRARVKLTDQLMRRIEQMNGHISAIETRMDAVEKSEQECLDRERVLRREVENGAREQRKLLERIEGLEKRENGH